MANVDTAMILAAGRGERMRPLTDNKPKPMLPLLGKPLMQYHIESLVSFGIKTIVINHAWQGEQIESYFGNGQKWGVNIQYSPEVKALETAGGIIKALPLLGDSPFLVVNGDVFCDVELASFCANELSGLARLLLVENPAHNINGDFAIGDGMLCDKSLAADNYTFSGIALYSPQFFSGLAVDKRPLAPLIREYMNKQLVEAELYTGKWCDVGTPDRLTRLEEELQA